MYRALLLLMTLVQVASCQTMHEREKVILDYSRQAGAGRSAYEQYLVQEDQYTTNGVVYHRKYRTYLLGIARYMIEEKKYAVLKNCIGFYFDKRENIKSRLYLGLDVELPVDASLASSSGRGIALSFFNKHLSEVLYVLFSCKTIFAEAEVVGAVVGFQWRAAGSQEIYNIWIDKKDVIKFENGSLTLREIVERNIITDTRGKVVKLSQ
ncbi:MAG TPA: hypothetical protein PKM65_05140 [Spirochaetota bacterium]|nr:hypothetical protein [Spirochaetota bacterium]HNT10263.1 hypothetical protein [Spirochaetota bacterium]HNV48107.1 hypothetical protein [Spirochaetota bacterium]HOS41382.1 hypothetical protein [Spirochaetota bacterium]HPI22736.1 hypothetical protein [Spirochaetota bacterium]